MGDRLYREITLTSEEELFEFHSMRRGFVTSHMTTTHGGDTWQAYARDEDAERKVRAWDKALETSFKAITEILEGESETQL